jgi:DNA replication protein DnaC
MIKAHLWLNEWYDKYGDKEEPDEEDRDRNWNSKSFILYSPNIYGIGKTHLMCGLAMKLCSYKYKVRYITESQLMLDIRDTFNPGSDITERMYYHNILMHNDVLFIDDVGKIRPRDNNFLQGVYFNIIDQVYNMSSNTHTLGVATNLNLKELENHIGGASSDRLIELCGKNNIIKMIGESHRKNG